jgi:uncharacterized membrane protein
MQSRVRSMGHPVHPMLVVFPLGLFTTAVVFDLVHLLSGNDTFAQVGFWNITAGLVGVLLAAPIGLLDWMAIPAGTRAKRVGAYHGLGNTIVTVIFLLCWLVRIGRDEHAAGGGLFVLEVLALALAMVAGWLGGELVNRLAIGVDSEAHPDAPSSLSGGPARVRDDAPR